MSHRWWGGNRLTRLESSSDHPDGLGATGGFITPVGVWTFHKPSKTASSEETFDPDVESRRWTGAAPGHNRAGSQLGATSEKSDTQRPTYQCLVGGSRCLFWKQISCIPVGGQPTVRIRVASQLQPSVCLDTALLFRQQHTECEGVDRELWRGGTHSNRSPNCLRCATRRWWRKVGCDTPSTSATSVALLCRGCSKYPL